MAIVGVGASVARKNIWIAAGDGDLERVRVRNARYVMKGR
jgi:hypothetical protein